MGRRGLSALLFPSSKSIDSPSSPRSYVSSPIHHTYSESVMEENLRNAESFITIWNPRSSSESEFTYLFEHDRREAMEYLKSVNGLRKAMHYLDSENSGSDKLVLAQKLMQIAMKRLEKEFYQILSANRGQLHPEAVFSGTHSSNSDFYEGEMARANNSITEVETVSELAMADLKAIAECMIGAGYAKECVKIYKLIRKSIVDEGLYLVGIEKIKSSSVQKMNWDVLEILIKNWLSAVKVAVKTLFAGEKALCDHVFAVSETIRESCFADISKGAMALFKFPELVSKHKKSQERIFQLLELYEAISEVWPEIEVIFVSESTSEIKLQALSSLHKLGHSVCTILSDFESTIQKDSSKIPVTGGGIHPLTESVMSYISSLADYNWPLSDIAADYTPPENSSFPESYSYDGTKPAAAVHLAWLILVLLCKLDRKAEQYKDVALSYLFLANNLQFIIEKVQTNSLKELLGEEWMFNHTKKVKQYALSYELQAWNKVFSSLPEKGSSALSPEESKECFRSFNAAFEETYAKQTSWIVPDGKLRDELKVSIAKKLVPMYKEFYETHVGYLSGEKNLEVLLRIGPDDLGNYLSDLFHGTRISGGLSSSASLHVKGCMLMPR